MKIIILASGSKGNCTYIETDQAKILIDAGISYKRLQELLLGNGIILKDIDAILVTHEHIDHVMHLGMIAKKTNAKVFIAKESLENLPGRILNDLALSNTYYLNIEKKYTLKDITFVPIQLFHDTKNAYGYLFKIDNHNIAYITDTGHLLPKYYALLKQMNVLIIESNHDVEMLLNSNRDYRLKQRILSNKGHLSNVECANILKEVVSNNTKEIILAHLSEECNTEELALKETNKVLKETEFKPLVKVAKQHETLSVLLEKQSA